MKKASCLLGGTLPTSCSEQVRAAWHPTVEPTTHLMAHQVLLFNEQDALFLAIQILLLWPLESQRLRKEDWVEVVSGQFVMEVGEASGNH